MFEARFQTYWADCDSVGIVYYPNFFRFVEHAEEELFRRGGMGLQQLMQKHAVWFPRVEAFSKFSKPIQLGAAIRVRLNPKIQGQKTIRYEFEIVADDSSEALAAGYVTVVCVHATAFKSTPIPGPIRDIIENA